MNIFKRIATFPYLQIFLAAAFLRLFLAPFFFHPDIKTIYYNSQFLSQGVFNIYDYLEHNPVKAFLGQFVYPPISYLFFGMLYPLVKIIAGSGFREWLGMGNEAVNVEHIFRYLFLIKLPILGFEFLIGFLLLKFIKEEKARRTALLIWFFNPINLYIISMMGQFDVIPAFLTVLALFLALGEGKWEWSAILLGIGAGMKSYPILLLPFLVIASRKSWYQQIKLLTIGLIPYIIAVFPFLGSVSFREATLVSGLSQRMFLLGLPIGFGEQILLVLLALIILFLSIANSEDGRKNLISYFLAVPLVILAGSHFHPQWFIWAMPFLILSIVRNKNLIPPFILLCLGWFGITFLFEDKFLGLGLLSPLDQGVLFFPPVRELLKGFVDPGLVQSIFHTLFSASAIWLIYLTIVSKSYERR